MNTPPASSSTSRDVTQTAGTAPRGEIALLLFSIFAVAACGLAYELLIGAIASYLLGGSVVQFSIVIGLFLSGMGLGAWASRWIHGRLLERFIAVEAAIGVLGGSAGAILFAAYTYTGAYHVVMYSLVIAIAALTGLEIPLLTRYIQRYGSLREAIANVLSFDYLGALVASILFPLVLLPTLGLLKTSIVVGMVNVLVALLTTLTFRRKLTRTFVLWSVVVLGGVSLTAELAMSARMVSVFESSMYRDEVVYTEQTQYQRIVVTRYRDDIRLFLDGALQLSSRDEYRYHEPLVHPPMAAAARRERVLILGGGDGMAAREVLRWPEVREVTLVDIDPGMTALGRDHPALVEMNGGALSEPRVAVHNDDAFTFLQGTSDLWDVIIVDFPDPRSEALAKLYSTSFYGLLRRHLAGGGAASMQATSPLFARTAYWCAVTTAEAAGLRVSPYHAYVPSFGEWGFLLLAERAVDAGNIELPFSPRFLDADTRARLFRFPPDMERPADVEVNRLDHPVILDYYKAGWDEWF